MVTRINPTNPPGPPGDSPGIAMAAKKLAVEINTTIAELSNLDLKNLEPKLIKVAQLITNLCDAAKQALKDAGK